MNCQNCGSLRNRLFNGEVAIHFPGLDDLNKSHRPGVPEADCRLFLNPASGSASELGICIGQKGHHFVQRDNVEPSNRTNQFQPVAYGLSWIKQFELNLAIVSPSFEKN